MRRSNPDQKSASTSPQYLQHDDDNLNKLGTNGSEFVDGDEPWVGVDILHVGDDDGVVREKDDPREPWLLPWLHSCTACRMC